MINPSVNGWIDKYFQETKLSTAIDEDFFYRKLRNSGFIYGTIIDLNSDVFEFEKELTKTEISKIVYLDTLHQAFILVEKNVNKELFISKSNAFYEALNPEKKNLIHKILPKNSGVLNLENSIDSRIYINENTISKNFSNLVTNAFLFLDILAFQYFLKNNNLPKEYLKNLEQTIMNVVTLALKTKSKKNKNDDLLISLFENSRRYSKYSEIPNLNLENLNLELIDSNLEKKYILDLASLTLWSDGKLEENETYFLFKLAEFLKIEEAFVQESIDETNEFILKNNTKIPLFKNSNSVKKFYDQTTQTVAKLIIRNKKRLTKEILESKELMQLLAKSTQRDLSTEEKKKVKKQLLDICKSIPSLTIFLLPGGSLLMPILIKFIPQLLPSSFNENLND